MTGDGELADGANAQFAPGEGHRARQGRARPVFAAGCLLE